MQLTDLATLIATHNDCTHQTAQAAATNHLIEHHHFPHTITPTTHITGWPLTNTLHTLTQ